ncbi:glycosyltransferase family 4 protein [Marivita sp. S6314]|uniref:glycosyltransferase family 4 protein n=1 Tax=Marivita sp. S6314 TaxID=2926406 RepID=UPI001FF1810A|nr:glycosyltransferase family 4 protein [Marivita sp. S6314]MCK0149457.1 glycosyltransferase family 4 protein [Marivita sp. S6314]
MTLRKAAFAIPGDINTVTGGYIYERLLLENLRALGHDVQHIPLGGTFPTPTPTDMRHAIDALIALPKDRPLILDGLVYGAIDTAGLAAVRAPIVAMIHHPLALETGLDADLRDHLFRTEKDNLDLAQHVLVPSPHTADILATTYDVPRSRMSIARPGTVQPTIPRSPQVPPLILSVGIQHPRKGHDILLRALADIRHLEWQATVVGSAYDAAYSAELHRLVAALDLTERVTLTGQIGQDDLNALYSEASLFALATLYEGYGIVFNDALAWGLPIVSCRTGAVPETVPADAGLLVAPDDVPAFADALQRLLTQTDQRTSLADAAARHGADLPGWMDTARIASRVLNGLR